MKKILISSIILLFLVSCQQLVKNSSKSEPSLPQVNLTGADGNTIDLASLKGKKVFLNLWATWCPPCIEELPSIQNLYENSDKEKVAFVMISLDKSFSTAQKWIGQKGYSLPIYAVNGPMPDLLDVSSIPTTYIFDETGKMIFSKIGSMDYNKPKFRELLSK